MSLFIRKFDFRLVKDWDARHPGNAVRALFDRWALPGEQTSVDRSLRLCVRRGYVNFYHFGQSIAAIQIGAGGPRFVVHKKYAAGLARGDPLDQSLSSYSVLGPEAVALPSTADRIAGWIAAAQTYASAEKRFVDDLVAANPGVIDLEMGLPSSGDHPDDRVAPRMDLALIQTSSHGQVELAFWEAKCSTNAGVRSRADIVQTEKGWTGPRVVGQLDAYRRWISAAGRADEVRVAYKEVARLLIAFHQAFGRGYTSVPECVRLWQALAEANARKISVVARPGLAIGNYCPSGHSAIDAAAFVRNAATFLSLGHSTKLERHGIILHEVGPDHAGQLLPRLAPV